MQIYKRIDEMSKCKFIAPDGKEVRLINVEVEKDGIIAEFVPFNLGDDWSEDDVIDAAIDFTTQEGESVCGHEYPDFRSYEIQPGDEGFDRDRAASEAMDVLFGEYRREVGHAA